MTEVYIVLSAAAPIVLGGLHALVRFSVKQGIREQVNGQIDGVSKKVDRLSQVTERIERRLDSHDMAHASQTRQLMAALERQGIAPPDGWDTEEIPTIGKNHRSTG